MSLRTSLSCGNKPRTAYFWTILLGKQYLLLWGLCLCYLPLKTFLSGTESEVQVEVRTKGVWQQQWLINALLKLTYRPTRGVDQNAFSMHEAIAVRTSSSFNIRMASRFYDNDINDIQ